MVRQARLPGGLATLVLLSPASVGYHLSAGMDDAVGVSPRETPNDASVDAQAHAIGTATDCDPVRPRVDAGTIQRAAFGDRFCGELVYHEDSTFETSSTPDQDLRSHVGTFDVVPANRLKGLEPCLPWCPSLPASQAAWSAVHTAGNGLGLTEDPETAGERAPEDRRQHVGERPAWRAQPKRCRTTPVPGG